MKFFFYCIIFISLSDLAYTSAEPINLSDLRQENEDLSDDVLIWSLIQRGADFSNGKFESLHLKSEKVIRSLFESGRSFIGSYFSHTTLKGIENLKLRGDFTSALFKVVHFPRGTDFTLANLNQTQFIGSKIGGGSFVGMELEGTSFEDFTELQRVNLEGALLKGVQLNDVKIKNSNFKNTRLVEVKFYRVSLYGTNLLESQPQDLTLSDVFLGYDKIPEEFLSESERKGVGSMDLVDNDFSFFINKKHPLQSISQTRLKIEKHHNGSVAKYWIKTPHDKLPQEDFLSLKEFIMEQILKVYPFRRLSSVDLDQLERFLKQLVNVEVIHSDQEVQKISDFLDTQRANTFGRFEDLSSSNHKITLVSLEVRESVNKILNEVFYLEQLGKEISLKRVLEQELDAEIMIKEKDRTEVGPSLYVVTILISGFKNEFWYKQYFYSDEVHKIALHGNREVNDDKLESIKFPINIGTFQRWNPSLKALFVRQGLKAESTKKEIENRIGPIQRFVEQEKENKESSEDASRWGQGWDGCDVVI